MFHITFFLGNKIFFINRTSSYTIPCTHDIETKKIVTIKRLIDIIINVSVIVQIFEIFKFYKFYIKYLNNIHHVINNNIMVNNSFGYKYVSMWLYNLNF